MDSTAAAPLHARDAVDFGVAPFLVIWEVTRACALACVHCRAEPSARTRAGLPVPPAFSVSQPRLPRETPLPLFVLTGGDPMSRKDLREIAQYASAAGLTLAATYRDDGVFRCLREPDALEGRCGRCRFRAVCGGSRSRAFSQTGNAFASDPLWAYEPGPEVEELVDSSQ
jgi:MoaA/NifB/PqqE/SkfB family radical SAM enzyme